MTDAEFWDGVGHGFALGCGLLLLRAAWLLLVRPRLVDRRMRRVVADEQARLGEHAKDVPGVLVIPAREITRHGHDVDAVMPGLLDQLREQFPADQATPHTVVIDQTGKVIRRYRFTPPIQPSKPSPEEPA